MAASTRDITFGMKLADGQFRSSLANISKGLRGLNMTSMSALSGGLRNVASDLGKVAAGAAKAGGFVGRMASNFVPGVKSALAVTGGFLGVMYELKKSFDDNSALEGARATFEAFTGSAFSAYNIVKALRKEADITPFDTGEMIDAGKSLVSVVKGNQSLLMSYIKTAEVMAAINPTQGLKGAAEAIKDALAGEKERLKEFGIGTALAKEIEAGGKKGIDMINEALKRMGAGPQLVDKLAQTYEGRLSTIMSFAQEIRRTLGESMFNKASSFMGKIVDWIGARGDYVLSIAYTAGGKLAEWAQIAGQSMWKAVQYVYALVKGLANMGWGEIMGAVSTYVGAVIAFSGQTLLALVKGMGKLIWGSIVSGIPALVKLLMASVIETIVITSPKMAWTLGLDGGISDDLYKQSASDMSTLAQTSRQALTVFAKEYGAAQKESLDVVKQLGSDIIGRASKGVTSLQTTLDDMAKQGAAARTEEERKMMASAGKSVATATTATAQAATGAINQITRTMIGTGGMPSIAGSKPTIPAGSKASNVGTMGKMAYDPSNDPYVHGSTNDKMVWSPGLGQWMVQNGAEKEFERSDFLARSAENNRYSDPEAYRKLRGEADMERDMVVDRYRMASNQTIMLQSDRPMNPVQGMV